MVLWIVLGIAALIVVWIIGTYNGLVKLRNMAQEACVNCKSNRVPQVI